MTGRIFVTGGGSGLGRAIAIRYARAGWRVCVADVNDAAYDASKVGVVSIFETLQHELRDAGIGVTVVCPGFFRTNLAESLRATDPAFRGVLERLSARSALTAADVADGIYRAVSRGRFYVLPHRAGRISWCMKRFLPRRLYAALVRNQLRRAGTRRRTTPVRAA